MELNLCVLGRLSDYEVTFVIFSFIPRAFSSFLFIKGTLSGSGFQLKIGNSPCLHTTVNCVELIKVNDQLTFLCIHPLDIRS